MGLPSPGPASFGQWGEAPLCGRVSSSVGTALFRWGRSSLWTRRPLSVPQCLALCPGYGRLAEREAQTAGPEIPPPRGSGHTLTLEEGV